MGDLSRFQIKGYKVTQRPPQTIKLPDNQHITALQRY
jgi:hypothetical protein